MRIIDPDAFPESITARADGTVIAGSMLRPFIYRAHRGERVARRWIDLRATSSTSYGVLADEPSRTLWVCTIEHPLTDRGPVPLAVRHTTLRAFRLDSGRPTGAWALPDPQNACNDIAVGPDGSVYVSDSGDAYRILRLGRDRASFETVFTGPEAERVDGIAFIGPTLYFASIATGRLYALAGGLSATPRRPIEIKPSRPLARPDGLRSHGGRLFVAESGADQASELEIQGDRAIVRRVLGGLESPSAVAPLAEGTWVNELKVARLTSPNELGSMAEHFDLHFACTPRSGPST